VLVALADTPIPAFKPRLLSGKIFELAIRLGRLMSGEAVPGRESPQSMKCYATRSTLGRDSLSSGRVPLG